MNLNSQIKLREFVSFQWKERTVQQLGALGCTHALQQLESLPSLSSEVKRAWFPTMFPDIK